MTWLLAPSRPHFLAHFSSYPSFPKYAGSCPRAFAFSVPVSGTLREGKNSQSFLVPMSMGTWSARRGPWAQGTVGLSSLGSDKNKVSTQPVLAWRQADDWDPVGYRTSPTEARGKQRTPWKHSQNLDSALGRKNPESK